ncbi:MAG: hypothetical protein IPL84_00790 [Chitinophagaceae bacterium]|nr:hypothetical protein [Chitinophagaceae bacterium]
MTDKNALFYARISFRHEIFPDVIRPALIKFAPWFALFLFISILLQEVFSFLFTKFSSKLILVTVSVFDWLIAEKIDNVNFHKGFNFSIVMTIIISAGFLFLLLRNSRVKRNIRFRFFILAIVFGIGFFISFYSLTNLLYNIFAFNSINEWFLFENANGLFTIRITSFVILYGLIKYIFNHILNRELNYDIGIRLRKYVPTQYGIGTMSYSNYSTVYFSQMGFYIITLCILFYSYRIGYKSPVVSILNWSLFFIIDDWAIIYNYTYRIGKIIGFDSVKIFIFNLLLLILTTILLNKIFPWYILILYYLYVLALLEIKLSNYKRIHKF